MAEAKTKEQLEKEWWDAWWAEDYSWDGLAKKPWVGWVVDTADGSFQEADAEIVVAAPEGRFRAATLQDYWRDQADDLVAGPDGTFTRVHLPPQWRNGMATPKAAWTDDALDELLAPKLISGAETSATFIANSWEVTGIDRRTQLQGAILLRAVARLRGPESPVHLQCRHAHFLGTADFYQQVFGPCTVFERAMFSRDARFERAIFLEDVWFESATFIRDARFGDATFSGETRFNDATFTKQARFENASFAGNAGFDGVTFNEGAWFERATFTGKARFDDATFSWGAWFNQATFTQQTWFNAVTFTQQARFEDSTFSADAGFDGVTFTGSAEFGEATFSGIARFENASFDGGAVFDGVTFTQQARFENASFDVGASFDGVTFTRQAWFESASFAGNAVFDSATFTGDACFELATFTGQARFDNATFTGNVLFDCATFYGDPWFERATFTGNARFDNTTFYGRAWFENATFSGDAWFVSATFTGNARFDNTTFFGYAEFAGASFFGTARFVSASFSGETGFEGASFSQHARFDSATFSGEAHFRNATFLEFIGFRAVVFDKLVSFEGIDWPSAARHWHRAFDLTSFKSAPVLTDAGFRSLAAFNGALLDRGIIFDDPSAKTCDRVFQAERRAALSAAKADLAAWVDEQERAQRGESGQTEAARDKQTPKRISKHERRQKLGEFRNRRLAELEGGCRTLKKAMEYASNKSREQLFYRYELIARRTQAATPLSEKVFSYLYSWFGNYGASIGRPFIAVSVLTLLFAGVYWGLDIGWDEAATHSVSLNFNEPIDPALEKAMSFSASRIFPFGAFDDVSASWLASYEAEHGSLAALGVRIVASLQTALALVLVFMVGLAVRRKFQIS